MLRPGGLASYPPGLEAGGQRGLPARGLGAQRGWEHREQLPAPPDITEGMSWSRSILPGPPTSPVGDVMQTPQFQLRRLKKQLALERDNRDELELELAENRKLITEKGQCLARGVLGFGGGLWG